jgi:hypothetical protein
VRPQTPIMHWLTMTRFYDERKPFEPAYSPMPPSKAGRKVTKENVEDSEVRKLLHAPPG